MDSREETGRRINMYRSDFTWSEQHTDTERELNVFSDSQMRRHTFSFLLALNFFRHSTVSCLCIMEATVERCCGETENEALKIKH